MKGNDKRMIDEQSYENENELPIEDYIRSKAIQEMEVREPIDQDIEDLSEEREERKDPCYFKRKKIQELEKCFKECEGQKMLVVIKGPPDPDSIASAWAHCFIAQYFNIETQIIHFMPISHSENKALVKALRINMVQYKKDVDLSYFNCYALVDTPIAGLKSEHDPSMPKIDLPQDMPLFSLVDHHKKTGKVHGNFIDIRENAGATSSIYAEYLQYGTYTLSANSPSDMELATALQHGIRTDTDNFFLAREIDWEAAAYLSRFADRDLVRQISSSSLTANTMDILQHALETKEIKDNYILAGVGYVRETDRDGIALAADYLVRREGIDTAIVFGIIGDQYIHGSLRTRSNTLDPDSFLKDVFDIDKDTGQHYGGGRFDKGGFQIPLRIFSDCDDKNLLWELVSKIIKSKIIKRLGGKISMAEAKS